ncbi:RNA polymerase sigma factor [Steroidobacter cummioxidans]|uniref:RNA polymerase sigma factor n=1 Tax=Steroidobacter cummioxidans TaxID=1803913 RepID=UPI000E32349C|nr:sigma-70 family RNA polymerase sigma factor [Steroidobacter cummioxidans]
MSSPTDRNARGLVADLFRRESGRLIALLANRTGVARIDMVEDAVQDALISAMRNWSINAVPANPSAWLYTAARNALTDKLRRARFEVPEQFTNEPAVEADISFSAENAFNDELLRLIAFCCHPSLTPASQLALTLRLACGLSVDEIAHALLTTPQSIMQRIVRAKRELRDADVTFDIAPRELVQERLPRILNAIYLLFDAGYLSPRHPQWFRPLLCEDALRLVRMLADHPLTAEPETHALAALLHLTAARSPARVDDEGHPVPLARQDRSRWNPAAINAGMEYFSRAIRGDSLTRYHIEAAIATVHASATSMDTTDWAQIVRHYDQLCELFPSPVATLNRVIALRYARGAQEALLALRASDELHALQDTLVYHATMAELHEALEEHAQAATAFEAAAELAESDTLAELFRRRARAVKK